MSDILFIKTSSLGDVIHHMPALTEARRRRPDARLSWVVEEAFAPLVRLHPAVDQVIPVAVRRWRGAALAPSTWVKANAFIRTLREREYDEIVDTQGLFFKSALIARLARGRRHGYDASSIREPAASRLYDIRHKVARDLHAIARNRLCHATALSPPSPAAPRPRARSISAPIGTSSPRRRQVHTGSCSMRPRGPRRNGWSHRGSRWDGNSRPAAGLMGTCLSC